MPPCLQVGPQIPRAALAWLLRDAERLQELALAPCHEWLSDEDLVPVLARNPQLRSVALAGCGQLSRRTLGALAEGCPRLQRLSLAHCDWVDGLALRGLADRCPALEELDLTACRQLKDEAIVYLAQRRGAGLRSLSLAVNANVGDTAVQELARNCPELEHLDLTGCLRVGSDGVRCLGLGSVGWEEGNQPLRVGMGSNQKAELGFLLLRHPYSEQERPLGLPRPESPQFRNFIEPVFTHWQFSPT